MTCDNYFDDMIWVVGHELFHYLRDTRQIEGKNTEAQANEFGLKCLKEFQRNHSTTL
jgi:Zn-dependent peptidase ImmA (M78 family)